MCNRNTQLFSQSNQTILQITSSDSLFPIRFFTFIQYKDNQNKIKNKIPSLSVILYLVFSFRKLIDDTANNYGKNKSCAKNTF